MASGASTSNKRLAMLEAMTGGGSTDPFAWYGLAIEYKNLERHEDAVATFERLRELAPDYLPMYLMAGQTLSAANRNAEAVNWLQAGLGLARKQGNPKAEGEISALLDELGGEGG